MQLDSLSKLTILSDANERLLVYSQEQSVPPAVETDRHIIRLKNCVKHQFTSPLSIHKIGNMYCKAGLCKLVHQTFNIRLRVRNIKKNKKK